MLPDRNRLRRSDDIATVSRRGRRVNRRFLVAHVQVAAESPQAPTGPGGSNNSSHPDNSPQFAFAVSRKVGGSVVRHRVTRRLRHLIRDKIDRFPPNSLIVIRALPRAAHASSAELGADLDQLIDRIHSRTGALVPASKGHPS